MRINKYLASANVASRRKAEEFVLNGRVTVNGKMINSLSTDVAESDIVCVDGVKILINQEKIYVMLNKPKGYITTTSDDRGRKTVIDLLPDNLKALKPVGRLDYDSEGLLLLTNDGEIANRLMHPASQIGKTYIVKIEGEITEGQLAVLRAGVVVEGKRLARCKAKVLDVKDRKTRLEITIFEGKNREIRKMFEAIGFLVIFLKRTHIGELKLSGLNRGEHRFLRSDEILYLKQIAALC